MFGVGKSAEERQREKERKKRGTRKYGQANLKQSRKGVLSCINGFGGLLILAGCIFYAFMAIFSMLLWQEEMLMALSAGLRSWRWSWLLTGSALRSAAFTSGSAII